MIQVLRKGLDHTGMTTACRVESNLLAAGAEAAVSFICAPEDYYLPKLNPACGDPVEVLWDGEVLFSGKAERVSFSSDGLSVSMTCFDPAARLAKNELYAVFAGTPGAVAAKVLERLGLTAGEVWPGEGSVFIPAGAAMGGHGIIRQAYGDRCVIRCREGLVDILEPGAREASLADGALLGGTAAIDVQGMVNRAQVVGYKGRSEAVAESGDNIAAYGLRQKVYSLSGARHTARAQASGHLRGGSRQGQVRLLGGTGIRCGDSLGLGHRAYGLNGTWLVTRVCHEIEAGVLVTTLSLEET